jgi:hypothetical protein
MGGQGVTSNDTRSKAHVPEKNGAVNVRRKRHGRNGSFGDDVECHRMSERRSEDLRSGRVKSFVRESESRVKNESSVNGRESRVTFVWLLRSFIILERERRL